MTPSHAPADPSSTEVVVLDGGLATTLAAAGHDISGPLWSARVLRDEPAAVEAAHRAFLEAGAEVVTTASYQLSAQGLAAAGHDRAEVDGLLARSVELARRAVTGHAARTGAAPARVAASIGPYGAVLADGSEYRGHYGLDADALRHFHHDRLASILAAGPDLLAVETIPSGAEIAALAPLLRGCGVPTWVSLTVGTDGTTTPEGQPLLEALRPVLSLDEVVAVGVNCCPPAQADIALVALAGSVDRPLVVYPNLGATWDDVRQRWAPAPDDHLATTAQRWVGRGVRYLGGCCGTTPEQIARLAAALR